MAQFRPAGLSDEDSDTDDDYGFYEKPFKKYYPPSGSKKTENDLQEAILNGHLNNVQEIISSELNNSVNLKLDSGWTPLMHACFHAQDKIVQYLLDIGADPNLHADSVTPIMAACSNSSANNDTVYNIIMTLINKDCLLNIGDKYGQTPLMRAIGSGRVSVVQKLLDMNVNIEMRDQQGWTAIFWAAHHNQPEILELLVERDARLTEVDKSNRTPLDIAISHDYQNIVEMLKKHLNIDDKDDSEMSNQFSNQVNSWHDYYPGIKNREKLKYVSEIPHLLYGMNCERLSRVIDNAGMDLRTFLLLEENEMINMGIIMPYERQRLKNGLRNFHKRGWKLSAVAGLYARRIHNFSVLDCLTTLGTHLQQVYVLEATLQYILREYGRIQNQIKFEPPDSPVLIKIKTAANKMLTNINSIRRETKHMKKTLTKITTINPEPADLIKARSTHDIVSDYVTEVAIVCSLGLLVYYAKNLFTTLLNK